MWSRNICLCKFPRGHLSLCICELGVRHTQLSITVAFCTCPDPCSSRIHPPASAGVRLDCSSSGPNREASLVPALPLRWDPPLLPGQAGYIFSLAGPWPPPGSWLRTPQRLARHPKGVPRSSPSSSVGSLQCQRAPDPCIVCGCKTHRPVLL